MFFHVTYSVGASIVILGALAKIIHFPNGDIMLIIGMLVEALVFLLSAFDVEQVDFEENSDTGIATTYPERNTFVKQTGTYQAPGYAATTAMGGGQSNTNIGNQTTSSVQGNISGAGNVSGNISGTGSVNGSLNIGGDLNISEEYLQEIETTTKKMASFSKVMSSLNDMSEKILEGCNQINSGAGEFGDLSNNMSKLNSNVAKINDLYEGQLSSIETQMSTLSYIAQSLERIKGLYSNTVIDSDIFRMENQKMAQQIQELNRIYARLLQAMNVGSQMQANYPPQPYMQQQYPPQGYNQPQQPYNTQSEGNNL